MQAAGMEKNGGGVLQGIATNVQRIDPNVLKPEVLVVLVPLFFFLSM